MKERVTFLLHVGEEGFDPARLNVEKDGLTVPPIKAAKEHRITFGLSELTQEIRSVLKQCHELHIRWATSEAYTSTPPFVSRTSPGLHVYFTPRREHKVDGLCPLLQKTFGDDLKCKSPSETFITPPILAERFSMSASSQYHSLLPSLENLVTYIQQKMCTLSSDSTCETKAASLLSADYVDMDFDTISHALVINAFWSKGPKEGGYWNEKIKKGQAGSLEVGILNNEVPVESEELSLSGFLTVIGEDTKPKATLFSLPSRHHPLPSIHHPVHPSYSVSFSQPTGLHPTLHLSFPRASTQLTAPLETCALHTYLTLPSGFFLDKYQFSDHLFLKSHNLAALHALAGATDLEAPDWVVPAWGSIALFELRDPASAIKDSGDGNDVLDVSIPLHLRYQPPNSNSSGLADAHLPWPVVFWACPADEGTKFPTNPFDRTNLGYEGLFGPRVMFYHVPPAASTSGIAATPPQQQQQQQQQKLVETIKVPVLDLDKASHVEWGTVLAVLVASAWLLWKLVGVVKTSGLGRVPADAPAAASSGEAAQTGEKKGQ